MPHSRDPAPIEIVGPDRTHRPIVSGGWSEGMIAEAVPLVRDGLLLA